MPDGRTISVETCAVQGFPVAPPVAANRKAYDKMSPLCRQSRSFNGSREARCRAEDQNKDTASIVIDDAALDSRRNANWPRLIQKVYEVDPLKCPNCGANLRIIALINDAVVVERILRHFEVWDQLPETIVLSGPDPSWSKGETRPVTYDGADCVPIQFRLRYRLGSCISVQTTSLRRANHLRRTAELLLRNLQ